MQLVTPAQAVAGIRSGDQVYVHCAAAAPSVLLDALVARAPELRDVGMIHLHIEGPGPHLAPAMAGHFRHRALFIGPNARQAVNEGRADYVPVFLSDVPHLFERGALPLDAVLVNATPPDIHGFCSLGTSVEAIHAAIRAADTVIVQFNRAMPRTLGDSFIHVNDIDLAVEVDVPPYERPVGDIGEVERRIGAHVAELVPDGATLQLGIGAIPAATALFLRDKQDLGIHTEMFTDSVVDLVEAGAITGAAKERNRGKIVTAFVMGSRRLYDFVHDNPMVEMRPVDFTNDTLGHPDLPQDGGDQLRHRGRPDRPGRRGFDRLAAVFGRGGPDGLHPRRGARRGGPVHHRPAIDRRRRHGLAHHGDPQGGCRRRHDTRARPDRGDRVRRHRPPRTQPARTCRGAHRDRPPGLPRRTPGSSGPVAGHPGAIRPPAGGQCAHQMGRHGT